MSTLREMFEAKTGKLCNKFPHYFDAYDRHFARFRGTDVHILEIGVDSGGSLDIWREYFGPRAQIFGMDFNPECKRLEDDGYRMFIGSQSDRALLTEVAQSMGRIDILIDDGGHRMEQQITTFETLFPKVSSDGVYVCEDINSSYEWAFGGGYKKPRTFVEFSKNLVDDMHGWYSQTPSLQVTERTRSIRSVHYYPLMMIVEEGEMEEPKLVRRGERTIPLSHMTGDPSFEEPLKWRMIRKLPWRVQRFFF